MNLQSSDAIKEEDGESGSKIVGNASPRFDGNRIKKSSIISKDKSLSSHSSFDKKTVSNDLGGDKYTFPFSIPQNNSK